MLHMTRLLGRIAAFLSTLAAAAAGQATPALPIAPAPAEVLEALGLSSATLQPLSLPDEPGAAFTFPLWLDGAWREVSAVPHSMRAPGFRLMVEDGSGAAFEHPPAPETTYRGAVAGFPGSVAALNLFEGTVQGIVRLGADQPWHGFQPLPGAAAGTHVVYSERDVLPLDVQCGGALDVLRGDDLGGAGESAPGPEGSSTKICEIALDADFEYFQKNGSSVLATQNDITNVINAVEAIYEAQTEIVYDITVIYVETAEPDPYSSTSAGTLLDQFQNHWNAQHQGDQRDVAHLFTGKNISGSTIGIAYLSTICNKSQGYGLSESKFSSSFTFRVGLTAHELGHSWSANHCDGQPDCGIMCSGIGGCAGSLTTFGASAKASILAKKAASGCLATEPPPSPPILTGLVPGTVQAFQGGAVSLSGFFLEDVTTLHVGSLTLASPFGFIVESDNLITFNAPSAVVLGTVPVTAENAAGVSNPLNLTFVETNPPKLSATALGLTGALFNWSFGGASQDSWFLFVALNNPATVPFGGFSLLASGTLIANGVLSATGLGNAGLIVPPGAVGASVYSQALMLDGATFAFVGATNVFTSTIFF